MSGKRPVTVFRMVRNNLTKKYEKEVECTGLFHQWGSAHEECETGFGNYTTAIVELPDGSVIEPAAWKIRFDDVEAGND